MQKASSIPAASSFASTRSSTDEDARRDFDGFDIDAELVALRTAIRRRANVQAAHLAANIDEWLTRGGSLPAAWRNTISGKRRA